MESTWDSRRTNLEAMRYIPLPYLLCFAQAVVGFLFLGISREVAKKAELKQVKTNVIGRLFLVSLVLAALACFIVSYPGDQSQREVFKVFSAPFFMVAGFALVSAGMQMVWAFNRFSFWRMSPGANAGPEERKIFLLSSTISLVVSAFWFVIYSCATIDLIA